MSLLDLIFPKRCVACGKFGDYICAEDRKKITPAKSFCPVCLKAAVGGTSHAKCKGPLSLDGLICIFHYSTPTKEFIHEMKYRFVKDASLVLKEELREQKSLDRYDFSGFVLVPIPLHKTRENWRGFNQTETMGKLLGKRLKVKMDGRVLIKENQTRPQVELKKKERLKQMRGVFTLAENSKVRGKDFIVFDDVWTTGATIKAAASLLKRKGAARVWGIALASSH